MATKRMPIKQMKYLLICLSFICGCAGCGNDWSVYETQHLKLYYKKGSYAERNLQKAATIYEDSYRHVFETVPVIEKQEKLRICLHEKYNKYGLADRKTSTLHYAFSEYLSLTSSH